MMTAGGEPRGRDGPPRDMEEALALLGSELPEMPRQVRIAARYVVDHPGEVAVVSMREIARRAGVGPGTVLRMAGAVGFGSYEELRSLFVDAARTGFANRARGLQAEARAAEGHDFVATLARGAHATLDGFFGGLGKERLDAAAKLIASARSCHVLGARSCYSVAHYLYYVGRMVVPGFVLSAGRTDVALDDLAHLGPRDCVVAFSFEPYAASTIRAAAFARERGAAVIAITDSLASPLARVASVLFTAPADGPNFFPTMVGAFAAAEAILAAVTVERGAEGLNQIEEHHSLRRASGVYHGG